jgi:hypothetical protein
MGWHKIAVFGESEIKVCFSSTGQYRRHLDRGDPLAAERLRLSGRHLRLVICRKALTEDELPALLRDHRV